MACYSNRANQQSAQGCYNNTNQTYVADGTQVEIAGVRTMDDGIAITTDSAGFRIRSSGRYSLKTDVTSTPSAAGLQTIQFYMDGVAIPSAIASDTTVADATITQHCDTVFDTKCCCSVDHYITLKISGVAGTISHVQTFCVKDDR